MPTTFRSKGHGKKHRSIPITSRRPKRVMRVASKQRTLDSPMQSGSHPYLTHNTSPSGHYDYWSVKSPLITDGVEWGFDFVEVGTRGWVGFLNKYKFRVVDEAPTANSGIQPAVYRNPQGIIIVTSRPSTGKSGAHTMLGYMRFEAPKDKKAELNTVLKAFRGPKVIKKLDVDHPGGIASYVKEETPNSAGFI